MNATANDFGLPELGLGYVLFLLLPLTKHYLNCLPVSKPNMSIEYLMYTDCANLHGNVAEAQLLCRLLHFDVNWKGVCATARFEAIFVTIPY
jgi:hypothetical protein